MTAGLRTVVASLVGETGSETDSSPETERRRLAPHARPWALGGRVLRASVRRVPARWRPSQPARWKTPWEVERRWGPARLWKRCPP